MSLCAPQNILQGDAAVAEAARMGDYGVGTDTDVETGVASDANAAGTRAMTNSTAEAAGCEAGTNAGGELGDEGLLKEAVAEVHQPMIADAQIEAVGKEVGGGGMRAHVIAGGDEAAEQRLEHVLGTGAAAASPMLPQTKTIPPPRNLRLDLLKHVDYR